MNDKKRDRWSCSQYNDEEKCKHCDRSKHSNCTCKACFNCDKKGQFSCECHTRRQKLNFIKLRIFEATAKGTQKTSKKRTL